jgi:hypothetical protein
MLTVMRDFLKPLFDCFSSLKMQLEAALSIPLTEANQFDDAETDASDDMGRSFDMSFDCVDDHPGYMTRNGLGSLEIGASHSRIDE